VVAVLVVCPLRLMPVSPGPPWPAAPVPVYVVRALRGHRVIVGGATFW